MNSTLPFPKEMKPRPPEEIDLGGDTYLLVGEDGGYKMRLKISTEVLSLASPYFRKLFSSGFKESTDLAQGRDIEIKDDNPWTFLKLCEVLHWKFNPTEQLDVEGGWALHFAVMSEKYDCNAAVALSARALFPPVPRDEDGSGINPRAAGELIAAAYLLEHAELFKKYTEEVIKGYAVAFVTLAEVSWGDRLPMATWCKYWNCWR